MLLALFGIDDGALNLVVNLLVLFLVVVWLALVFWTYRDAQQRIEDPVLVMSATAASAFPFVGTIIYTILRPPEFLEDAKERELEIETAALRVRQLREQACPNCEYPVERSYLRCPACQVRLKDPCSSCSQPVDPRWTVCPYCETPLRPTSRGRPADEKRKSAGTRERPPRRDPARSGSRSVGQGESRGPGSGRPGGRSTAGAGSRSGSSSPRSGSGGSKSGSGSRSNSSSSEPESGPRRSSGASRSSRKS